MADENVNKQALIIVLLCCLWYLTSSCNNVIGKTLLNEFPYPLTVTIAQLFSITIFSGPALKCMRVQPRRKSDISWGYYKKYLIPLSLGKFFAVVLSHVSLWKVPVSYTHTVKATMPLFTVVLARICFYEKQSLKVYVSLLPIMIGVGIATITELSFNVTGLLSALASTCVFSLLHIYSKKVLNDTGIHHLRLIHLLGKLAFLMFLPVWLMYDGVAIFQDKAIFTRREPTQTLILLFFDGLLNWLQNFIAFTILSRVSPLTYSVANASKRIAVITISLILLQNPVTLPNVFGMFLAIFGVFCYNKCKYDDNIARKKATSVPLSQVVSLPNGNLPHLPMDKYYPLQNGHPSIHYKSMTNGVSPNITMDTISRYFSHPLQSAPFHDLPPMYYPVSRNLDETSEKKNKVQYF